MGDTQLPFDVKYKYRILTLDGGGSKGVYSLGVLKEFEALVGKPLCEHFDLIYGTSTGAIIAALLGLGGTVDSIEQQYFELIPKVMSKLLSWTRTAALTEQMLQVFGTKKFDEFKTDVGIVATNYERERPMIFKASPHQAFRGKATFEAGFGASIAGALLASTAAFPFFRRLFISTANQGTPEVMDGGFVANNPTLFAIVDALQSVGAPPDSVRVLSVGVGHYQEPQKRFYSKVIFNFFPFKMMDKEFEINTNTIEQLRQLLFPQIPCIRIDESYTENEYATDLLEADTNKLRKLFTLGQESFRKFEVEVQQKLLG